VTDTNRLATALADRYRLERELGSGGMATVYLAHDVRHDRPVALKVLRPELAAILGGERFLHEIKTTANLQHPHILPLHDSGEVDGTVFYVMPYVEGESLRDRLNREKQLPVDDALRITREIASALDYAHRHGVIHRDIKPENVLLHDGQALVADFGIALAASSAGGSRMTETGMSLGTPHYMSPEQAMGERALTARSDVYALGCVLYEMLTGDPPFTGSTAQAIVAKVLTEKPLEIRRLRDTVPESVDVAVRVALAKLPADRFGSAAEFASALAPGATTSIPRDEGARSRIGARVPRVAWLGWGLAAAASALAVWGWLRPAAESSQSTVRLAIAFPKEEPFLHFNNNTFAVAPDGKSFVYPVGAGPSDFQLWSRRFDALTGSPIPGTHNAYEPAFSPDGRSLAFTAGTTKGELVVVPVAGGLPTTLVGDSAANGGSSWGDDGFVYFASTKDIRRVPATGGRAEVVVPRDSSLGKAPALFRPEILPGGKWLLYVAGAGASAEILARRLQTREVKRLGPGIMARYLPPGFLVMVQNDGKVGVARFDARSATLDGPAQPLVEGVQVLPFNNGAALALSRSGTLIYSAFQNRLGTPVWVDRGGTVHEIEPHWTDSYDNPSLSPDGSRVALSLRTGTGLDIWIKRLGGPLSRLTLNGNGNLRPSWSPDGKSVLFASADGGLYSGLADGSAAPVRVPTDSGARPSYEGLWSADRQWLIFRVGGGGAEGRDIYARRSGSDSAVIPLLASPADEYAPALSDDGRWLAYVSDESGRAEVYVRPFPAVHDGKWQVSTTGGSEPVWAHSGRELFYRNGANQLMAAAIASGSRLPIGEQHALFDAGQFAAEGIHADYAVSPDDRRFLMIRQEPNPTGAVVVVFNWLQEIRSRLGPAR
jgi:serine/threonine-protein kinase